MSALLKKTFRYILITLLLLVVIVTTYLYFFDNMIKANYYFSLASYIDDKNPQGSGEAFHFYYKALSEYENTNNIKSVVKTYIQLGLLHYKLNNMSQVEHTILKALSIGKEYIPNKMQAEIYLLLASTQEQEKAKEYIDKSLDISLKNDYSNISAKAYFLQAKFYEYKAEFQEAEKNYLLAVEAIEGFNSIDNDFNISQLYERLGELYAGGGKITQSIQFYEMALAYNIQYERGFITANYMKIIGDLYNEQHNYIKSCQIWRESKEEYEFFGAVVPFKINLLENKDKPCEIAQN